jgi:hypothetical protein
MRVFSNGCGVDNSYEGAKRRRFLADAVGSDVQMKLDLPEHSCAPFACTGG